MNDLFRQLRNERRANLWLGVELLVVFAVMWYLVDWTYVTVRTWLQPMGFDTEHCYNLSFNRLTPQAEGYRAEDDAEADMRHLLEIVERLRHRPGVEYVAVSQNSIPYNDGSNGFGLLIDSVQTRAMLRWGQPDYFRLFRVQGVAVLTEDGRKVPTASPDSLAETLRRSTRHVVVSRNYVSASRYPELGYADALPLLGYEGGLRDDGTYSYKITGICEPMRWSHFSTTEAIRSMCKSPSASSPRPTPARSSWRRCWTMPTASTRWATSSCWTCSPSPPCNGRWSWTT